MSKLRLSVDRYRLVADVWLHRHGPWWPLLVAMMLLFGGLAMIVIPRLATDLADRQATLGELQARLASQQDPLSDPETASQANYRSFRAVLATEKEVLPSIEAVLDSAEKQHLTSTRAEYQRSHVANALADTVQMTVPVRGRYRDVRRWIEDILARHAFVAVNELAFKREEIGLDQIEARVRLTIWIDSTKSPLPAGGLDGGEADP